MTEYSACIYRKHNTFELCGKVCRDIVFCHYHKRNVRDVYDIFYTIFGSRCHVSVHDIYRLYVYVCDNVHFDAIELDHFGMAKVFFIELLKHIPKNMLYNIYAVYQVKKNNLYNSIYELNHKTYEIGKKYDETVIKGMQKMIRSMILRALTVEADLNKALNSEDPFTYDRIDEIPAERLFTYCDEKKGIYAFDATELDYFVQKCRKDDIQPYNPYTRDVFDQRVLWKLDMFIKYNRLQRKTDEYRWQTELHAFTDLSMEVERRGFYNSPDWFARMPHSNLMKTIKLFKDFSGGIREASKYFKECKDSQNNFVYTFCKEGIKLFRECNEDLYILCCNFIKALAMCSRDFYDNMPEWLLNTNTASRLSSMYSLFHNIDDGFRPRPNRFMQNNSDNFLLYYYVEYME